MKIIFLIISASLLVTANCFCQSPAQVKLAEQKKANPKIPTTVINPVVEENTTAKKSVIESKTLTTPNQNTNTKVDSTKATLLDAFFSVGTARNYAQDPGTNKAADTHWSCVLFDQNDRQVASFQDNSNSDEYAAGSETPVLKMQVGNAAVFGDFSKGGRVHINIIPNGNDSWEISEFNLTLDFGNPKFIRKLTWNGIKLSQDKKDIDLFFYYEGNNTVPKYDIKANKEGR